MAVGGQRHTPVAAGWAPGLVWTGAGNLAPTGIQSPDCPARSKSLYRLSYHGRAHSGKCITSKLHTSIFDKYGEKELFI